jgi:hypothetical protein
MKMSHIYFRIVLANVAIGLLATLAVSAPAQQTPDSGSDSTQTRPRGQRGGRGGYGGGEFPAGARGMLGEVTAVAADHYTIKNDSGEVYTVHFSVNTRILKQPAGGGRRMNAGSSANSGSRGQASQDSQDNQTPRTPPTPLKPSDIKVNDVITAGGEIDTPNKSIGAIFIMQVDPERAKEMRAMEANYGKTWLAGRITAIDGTKITIDGMVDHAPHSIEVDENTSFKQRRDSITLADIKPGEQLRAEGAVKAGTFLATTINAMAPRDPNRQGGQSQPTAPASQ